jgi:hypothetical protein
MHLPFDAHLRNTLFHDLLFPKDYLISTEWRHRQPRNLSAIKANNDPGCKWYDEPPFFTIFITNLLGLNARWFLKPPVPESPLRQSLKFRIRKAWHPILRKAKWLRSIDVIEPQTSCKWQNGGRRKPIGCTHTIFKYLKRSVLGSGFKVQRL